MIDGALPLTFDNEPGKHQIDFDHFMITSALVQANSGGGKSRFMRWLLEQTHKRVPQIILDWEGEFSSLREKFDYLVAAADGDVPTDPKTARMLCRRVVDLGVSCIVDLYELRPDARREYVRLFLNELIDLPKSMWGSRIIAIDEAHMVCPEKGFGEAQSTSAVIDLCSLGRKRGLCAVLSTQRIAKLHKDAAADLKNKFIGNTSLDVDVARAAKDLGFDKEGVRQLKALDPGAFFAVGPAISREVLLVRGGDIQTTHPQPGKALPPTPPAKGAILELISQLRDLAKEAEEEVRNIEEAKARIAELEEQLANSDAGGFSEDEVNAAVQEAYREERERWAGRVAELESWQRDMAAFSQRLFDKLFDLSEGFTTAYDEWLPQHNALCMNLPEVDDRGEPDPPQAVATLPARIADVKATPSTRPQPAPPPTPIESNGKAKAGVAQNILDALAELRSVGINEPARHIVSSLVGLAPTTKSFTYALSDLIKLGLTLKAKGAISLSTTGQAAAKPAVRFRTRKEFHDRLFAVIGKTNPVRTQILRSLINAPAFRLSRAELAASVGLSTTTKSFTYALSDVKKFGFLRFPSSGEVELTDALFPKGLK